MLESVQSPDFFNNLGSAISNFFFRFFFTKKHCQVFNHVEHKFVIIVVITAKLL